MKRYLAELIGTFSLVLIGTGSVVIDQETQGAVSMFGIALSFGLVVSAMIMAFGNISGAHLNPAVTMAVFVHGRFPAKHVAPYMLSQTAGAFIASGLLHILFPYNQNLGSTLPSGTAIESFWFEFGLTFALMWAILICIHVQLQTVYTAIVIGIVIFLEAYFAGPISGASMNPARSIAPAVVSGMTSNLWLFIVAPITGSMAAVGVWKMVAR